MPYWTRVAAGFLTTASTTAKNASDRRDHQSRLEFEATIRTVKDEEKLIIGADMNGRVAKTGDGYQEVLGDHRLRTRNEDGEYVLEMAHRFELLYVNTWVLKLEKHLITYISSRVESQINHILVRGADKNNVMNC
ncbi:uncharacterized protein [Palaemon carinicauda]|uniref:uncharacterized protein n=1 Tax=Palaemon carinicauda TaxID=392227 RepID=UPI0035B681AE